MFIPGSLACATTQSIAAITWETSVFPWASASLRLTIREPGAMPRKCVLSEAYVDGLVPASRPAMIPAMWVPWPKASSDRMLSSCDSKDRSGPMTSLFGVMRPSIGSTPESSRATSTPWPDQPFCQNVVAPVSRATLVMSPAAPVGPTPDCRRTDMSGVTWATPGSVRRAATAAGGTSATSVPSVCCTPTTRPNRSAAAAADPRPVGVDSTTTRTAAACSAGSGESAETRASASWLDGARTRPAAVSAAAATARQRSSASSRCGFTGPLGRASMRDRDYLLTCH